MEGKLEPFTKCCTAVWISDDSFTDLTVVFDRGDKGLKSLLQLVRKWDLIVPLAEVEAQSEEEDFCEAYSYSSIRFWSLIMADFV